MSTSIAKHRIDWERLRADFGQADARQPGPDLSRIGNRMRAFYEDIAAEPIPEGLLILVKRLEERTA